MLSDYLMDIHIESVINGNALTFQLVVNVFMLQNFQYLNMQVCIHFENGEIKKCNGKLMKIIVI